MINVGIFDGDRVFVNSCNTARNGEIVVALVDDSATVKASYNGNGQCSSVNSFHFPLHSTG